VLPDGVHPASIHIEGGQIVRIGAYEASPAADAEFDAGCLVVSPGVVDTHVHINDPGRAHWEGFEHATRAAAAGGVTTLVDMPLNSIPPTTTVEGLEAKLAAAAGRCFVDVGFWGGVVPGNAASLEPLARMGVLGFKCFLAPSGVDEFSHVTERDLVEALPIVARLQRPLLAHAELPSKLLDPDPLGDARSHSTWLSSRPPESECAAIELLTALSRASGARIHIVHLAASNALPIVDRARAAGLPVTVETCPHYLTFAAADIAPGDTAFKCAPPIREERHREALWQGLGRGAIDLIATDHSPSPPELKRLDEGDFLRAWGGIASLQLGLRAVWTGASARGFGLVDLARWMAAAPARLAGLDGIKGAIAVGHDADLVIWDPEHEDIIDPLRLQHRHPLTPYAGMSLKGRIHRTIVRGNAVFDDGRFVPGTGTLLLGRRRQTHGASRRAGESDARRRADQSEC
jgi:allantoinase